MEESKVAAFFNAEGKVISTALPEVLALDTARIKKIQDELKDLATDQNTKGYNKGKAEALAELETKLKESYGITSDKKGIELVNEAISAQITKAGGPGKGGEPTEAQILQSKQYLALQDKLTTETKRLQDEFDSKWATRDQQEKVQKTTTRTRELVEKLFDDSKPVLSTDPARAAAQKKLFVDNYIANGKFMLDGEGANERIIPLGPDDKPKTDPHANRVTLADDFLGILKSVYDIQASDPKHSPPEPGKGTPPGTPPPAPGTKAYAALNLKLPANDSEYVTAIETIRNSKLTDAEKSKAQIELTDDWKAATPQS